MLTRFDGWCFAVVVVVVSCRFGLWVLVLVCGVFGESGFGVQGVWSCGLCFVVVGIGGLLWVWLRSLAELVCVLGWLVVGYVCVCCSFDFWVFGC